MTKIGVVVIDHPVAYERTGYGVRMRGSHDDSDGFNQLRELFAKAEFGSAVHQIPGERPVGEDLTDELRNTQLVVFTHGTSGKPQDGFYLLMPGHSFVENESPEGHSYVWRIGLFFLGTTSYYRRCYVLTGLERSTSDWSI